jgi:peptidoglycan/xylan/chitin deacetylase (PgdA/CDA1 family)
MKKNDSISIGELARVGIFLICVFIVIELLDYATTPAPLPPPPIPQPIVARSIKEIVRGDTTKKQVIFTFDGGAGAESTNAILSALAKHHVKGTFFLTGKFVEQNPAAVRAIHTAGHEIFSHTYDHPHLPELTDAEIAVQFEKMEKTLQDTIGITPKPYFRPPYGDRNERVLQAAFNAGYESIYWTSDALDWEEDSGMTAGEVKSRIINNVAPGTIYLMHLGDSITGQILDDVFTEIESKGYKLVSLTEGI